jgi:hypothetical protein
VVEAGANLVAHRAQQAFHTRVANASSVFAVRGLLKRPVWARALGLNAVGCWRLAFVHAEQHREQTLKRAVVGVCSPTAAR